MDLMMRIDAPEEDDDDDGGSGNKRKICFYSKTRQLKIKTAILRMKTNVMI